MPQSPVPQEVLHQLARKTPSKILLLVCDGLAGLPDPQTGLTEMETARTPNLDAIALRSMLGYAELVGPGITPGSGPGHLSIFGYDPLQYQVGRGVLSALGVGFPIEQHDVAARINFCTLDAAGNIVDRRAGRIPTEKCVELVERLRSTTLSGAELFLEPEMDYRAVVVFRGDGLSPHVTDTDPQVTGVPPLDPQPKDAASERTAQVAAEFVASAREVLRGEEKANGVLLRGFDSRPDLPQMGEVYGLSPAAIAVYPMYRGLASLVGMQIIPTGKTMRDELATLREIWDAHDFFFVHFKYTDSAGEDGDFARKVRVLEEIDGLLPELLAQNPDVFAMTGDHSTPAIMKAHSWHPSPVLISSPYALSEGSERFTERWARRGNLGKMHMSELMSHLLAHSGKLLKFGA